MKKISILLFLVLFSAPALADFQQGGQDVIALASGVGARALGMGGAFCAIAEGADSGYWNPAGLGDLKYTEATTMQTRLSTDADYYYVGYALPSAQGGFGLSWIQIGTGGIPQTQASVSDVNEVIVNDVFSYASNVFMFSYGHALNDSFSAGVTAKYLTQGMSNIAGADAYGFSLSPGFLLRPNDRLSFGLKVDELLNTQKWGTGAEETVPPKARVGIAYRIPHMGITCAVDASQLMKFGYATILSTGVEFNIMNHMFLRLGMMDGNFTAGTGFVALPVEVNYAYVSQSELTKENVHRISLSGKF